MTLTPKQTRISLRPRQESDAEALFATMSHPDSMKYWSRGPFTSLFSLQDYFSADSTSTSGWKTWAIVKANDLSDKAIGFVAAGTRRKGVSEIGYLVAREALGNGYGREAVSLLIERLFIEGERRVVADVDPENKTSIALLTALGFKLEGHLRAEWETHIGIRDSLIYGLLVEEWEPWVPR
ncbi:N-acetyltransferase GCN5, partial [Aureobasidium melanogenum]